MLLVNLAFPAFPENYLQSYCMIRKSRGTSQSVHPIPMFVSVIVEYSKRKESVDQAL